MPFRYSSFVSYRHTEHFKGQSYTEQIVEYLKAELELRVTQEVFRDVDRMRGAQFYNEHLATMLCQSVCMVVLYWPTYFSDQHVFCAREFKAMEKLEAKRLLLLPASERTNGLIILLALRDFDSIPAGIRAKRLCKNFEAYSLQGDMRGDPGFQQDLFDVAKYIAERVKTFAALQPDPFIDCDTFRLPSANQVLPWVRKVTQPALPLPTRMPGL